MQGTSIQCPLVHQFPSCCVSLFKFKRSKNDDYAKLTRPGFRPGPAGFRTSRSIVLHGPNRLERPVLMCPPGPEEFRTNHSIVFSRPKYTQLGTREDSMHIGKCECDLYSFFLFRSTTVRQCSPFSCAVVPLSAVGLADAA